MQLSPDVISVRNVQSSQLLHWRGVLLDAQGAIKWQSPVIHTRPADALEAARIARSQ